MLEATGEAWSGRLPYRGVVATLAVQHRIGPCCPIASPLTTSSTRRFFWRPSAVSLDATGRVFPNPFCGHRRSPPRLARSESRALNPRASRRAADSSGRRPRCRCDPRSARSTRDAPARYPKSSPVFRASAGRNVELPVSNSTSDMFTIKPRAVSCVCNTAFNCASNCARIAALSCSACAAAWRAFSASASALVAEQAQLPGQLRLAVAVVPLVALPDRPAASCVPRRLSRLPLARVPDPLPGGATPRLAASARALASRSAAALRSAS